jgi:excisionase family DNA binding protein
MDYFKSSVGGAEMADVANDNWINIDEAAEYLGVKPGTIRDWIRKDKGVPAHKVGKLWKFKRSELDAWIQSGKSAEN